MDEAQPSIFKETWHEMADRMFESAFQDEFWTESNLFSREEIATLREILSGIYNINAPAGLCLTDIGPWNTILKNGDIDSMYLIDWELAEAGPIPYNQFACVGGLWGYKSQVMGAFLAGYGLPEEQLRTIEEDVKRLTVLNAMDSFRWEQAYQPENALEYAESAHFIAHDLFEL